MLDIKLASKKKVMCLKKLIFGMPTLIELISIEGNVKLCKNLGLQFVEINMNMPYCFPEYNEIEKLKKLKKKYNVSFTMHFPEEIDFGTFYKETQDANISLFKRYIEYGAQFGVEKVNIHLLPGTYVSLPDRKIYLYEKYFNKYLENLRKSLSKIIKIAAIYKIKVYIENAEVPKFLEKIFLNLKSTPGLYFTYDIGHDAVGNYNVEKLYYTLGDKVKHMHLHDYNNFKCHQILFNGKLNLYEKLNFAKKNEMSIVVEVKTIKALEISVDNLKNRNLM